MLVLCHCHWFC